MVARKSVNVFEAFDRSMEGMKIAEGEWNYQVIPSNAALMKERYNIEFGDRIIPDDQDLVDRLFVAGVDMLITTGFYNPDFGRKMTVDEDEIYEGLKLAPKKLTFGSGKDSCECRARRGNDSNKPVIQGGPTGAPISEEIYTNVIRSYAQEPVVDTIVSGIINTVDGHPASTNSPWEIMATMSEIRKVREATTISGRCGMGI